MTAWSKWLNELTPVQRKELEAVVKGQDQNSITIVRTAIEDCLYPHCPPYVDVFNLLPLYQRLAFQKNLLIKGPKGDGKSLSIVSFASATQTPLITAICSEDTKKKDLIGTFYIRGDETPFMLGVMPTAIDIANEYGRAIIVFEEVNALTPQTQKQLNEFLDFRKSVSIPQVGKTYRIREGATLWIVATMNPSVYGGTYELNEDFRSRWMEVDLGYPSQEQEMRILEANLPCPNGIPEAAYSDLLRRCVKLAAETRSKKDLNYALSTRDVVSFASSVFALGIDDALQLLSHKFEGKDHEVIATRISSTFSGSPKVREKWNSVKAAV